MKFLAGNFFERYAGRDVRDRQKAEVIVRIAVAAAVLLFLLIFSTILFQKDSGAGKTVLGIVVMEVFLVSAIVLTRRGFNGIAAHVMLVPLSVFVWILMFGLAGVQDVFSVVDTIVYHFVIIGMAILIANRTSVVLYTLVNMTGLVIFTWYMKKLGMINTSQFGDYLADNTVGLVMLGYIGFMIIRNSNNAHQSIQQALEESNLHRTSINSILTRTSEMAQALASSTEEMAATTSNFTANTQSQAASVEEITSTVEEVAATGESVFAMAEKQAALTKKVKSDMESIFDVVTQAVEQTKNSLSVREDLNRTVERSSRDCNRTRSYGKGDGEVRRCALHGRHHRRHLGQDQSAFPERRDRSGPGRGVRQGFCGGGRRDRQAGRRHLQQPEVNQRALSAQQ
jgi:hypothetical protein